MDAEDAMGKPRRKTPRKAKSITLDSAQLDVYLIDAHGKPYRPWTSVEMDSESRLIRSSRITAERPHSLSTQRRG